jgi:2-octaprenyl-6-methoxyphenol hydroxylase
MLEELGIWQRLEGKAQYCRAMNITDSRVSELVRPVFLTIAGAARDGEPFAHFVDGRDLQQAIVSTCDDAGLTVEHGIAVSGIEVDTYGVALGVAPDRDEEASRLLVGADGAKSSVRRAAGIKTVGWSYGQGAIITIIETEVSHDGEAVQHFLPGGPFAMLPLPNNRRGIVWTEKSAEAVRLAALDSEDFAWELEQRAGPEVGEIGIVEPPRVYPLDLTLARAFVVPRVALVGDAAHRLHPLAGLGLNMGLRDVAALAQVLVEAARRGEDIGALTVLERYQRWRRFDTVQVAAATEAINRLFSNDLGPLRALRDVGLGLVDRMAPLKKLFVNEAAGDAGSIPRLMRGEPV